MIGMGIIQIIAACFQVVRGNIYGSVAFLGFGAIWVSSGLREVLVTFFSGYDPADNLIADSDPWGDCIRALYELAFSVVLLIQTLRINRLSTSVITLLCFKLLFAAFAGWNTAVRWIYFVFSWLTSFMAFYVSMVEMTNQVYQREVFRTFKWSESDSPDEVFGASGRPLTLYSKAMKLRAAKFQVHRVRSAMVTPVTTDEGKKNL